MRKVIGIGETILDIVFKENQPYTAVPGGSVFNGLVSLGRLGQEVLFVSELGNDKVGDLIQAFMQENHISTQYMDRSSMGKTPVSLAFLDDNQNANYIFYKDCPKQHPEVFLPPIEKDDIFIYGSYYVLNPTMRKRTIELLDYAREQGAILYYDPNFRKAHIHEAIHVMPSVLENLEYADIVRGSDEDFFNLFGECDPDKLYQEHIQFYCPVFLLTRGKDGVELHVNEKKYHYDAPKIEPKSTIGAGDSFNAGILYGLLKQDVRKADLTNLKEEDWRKIVGCGMELATEVCQSYDNYIAKRTDK